MNETTRQSGEKAPRTTILVVDDDAEIRGLMEAYLQADHRVLLAENGTVGLETFGRESVDAVILDVSMPGMNGFEVCREIKARAGERFVPVLMFTTLTDQEDRNRGLEAGADDFLAKDVDRRELRLRIGTFLRIRRQEDLILRQLEDLGALAALKDDLVSLIVHDLRSPVAGVLGLLQAVLRDPIPDPTLREDLEAALVASEKVRRMVDDMVDVKPLESGELALHETEVEGREIVQAAFEAIAPVARERGIELGLADGEEVSFSADPSLLRRAITNLLLNGIQYSRRAGRIDVAVRRVANAVEFDVSDRGEAVPLELKDTLFEKFGAVASKKRAARRGYGLGHYFVKLVAVAHGGSIEVCDRDGGGTTMRLAIPTPLTRSPRR